MQIVMVSPDEKLAFKVDESTVYYRRISNKERLTVINKNKNKRGIVNMDDVLFDIAHAVIIGWDGILDTNSKDVPFQKEYVEFLPATVLTAIAQLALESTPEQLQRGKTQVSAKNS